MRISYNPLPCLVIWIPRWYRNILVAFICAGLAKICNILPKNTGPSSICPCTGSPMSFQSSPICCFLRVKSFDRRTIPLRHILQFALLHNALRYYAIEALKTLSNFYSLPFSVLLKQKNPVFCRHSAHLTPRVNPFPHILSRSCPLH